MRALVTRRAVEVDGLDALPSSAGRGKTAGGVRSKIGKVI